MPRLLRILLDICVLRAGPQDLPYSRSLLGLTLVSYFFVSWLLSVPGYPIANAFLIALADLSLLLLFAVSLLFITGKTARMIQTLAALTGTGTLLGLVALPLVQILAREQLAEQLALPAGMLWLALFGWSLLVVAHIMRHAMSVSLPVAIGVSVVYVLVAIQIVGAFSPAMAA
jgi:hypothetical protein